jgi:hypothetical protein
MGALTESTHTYFEYPKPIAPQWLWQRPSFTSCQAPSEVSLFQQQIVEAHGGISQPEPKHLNPTSQQHNCSSIRASKLHIKAPHLGALV